MAVELGEWRREGLLLCLLPVFCWPAVVGSLLTRPVWLAGVLLAVLACPVGLGLRELYAARRVRRALRRPGPGPGPGPGWVAYDAEVVRLTAALPVRVLVLVPDGRVLSLGLTWRPPLGPAPVRLGPGGAAWIPAGRRALGFARPLRRPWAAVYRPRAAAAAGAAAGARRGQHADRP
ncbi:hypothetical protein ACFWBF_04880 [Streptomyces sp. NPDC060028]|uniref:hypothetical protein n=1 Tax=Streptomyces sp. NPDC060028 TaxID=3347041 RepID=UPI0036978538